MSENEMTDLCPVCAEAFKPDDACLTDIELGICHAACLQGSPIVFLDTGEPVPEGSPAPKPFRWGEASAPNPHHPGEEKQ